MKVYGVIVDGYLELNERKYFFVFDEFKLKLIPRDRLNCTIEEIRDALSGNSKEVIPEILEGRLTNSIGNIYFFVKKVIMHTVNTGVYEIEIYSYISNTEGELRIDALLLCSEELDWFYNIRKGYDYSVIFGTGAASVNLKENDCLKKEFQFELEENTVTANLSVSRVISNMSRKPVTLQSNIMYEFNTTDNLKYIFKLIHLTEDFLSFIAYRKNTYINNFELKKKQEDGKFVNCGKIYIDKERDSFIEKEDIVRERIIDFDLLEDKCGKLFQEISDNNIYLGHIPLNSRDLRIITPARFILITAAFEWEFRQIYGESVKARESDNFRKIKAEVIAMFDEKISNTTGKEKNTFKRYKNIMKNIDMNLSDKIIRVLEENRGILEIFIKNLFFINKITDVKYSEIAKRIESQRNNYAHGNIDKEINTIVILDLLVLEWAVYCMVLKEIGLDENGIKKCINKLFNRNMAL